MVASNGFGWGCGWGGLSSGLLGLYFLLVVGLILVVFCIWFFFVLVVGILASWWLVVMGGCHCGIGLWLKRLW